MRPQIPAMLVSLVLPSCFHAVGRLSFPDEGVRETVVELPPGEVRFAADVAVRYSGEAIARYEVDLLQGGHVTSQAICNPLMVTGRRSCRHRFGNRDFDCSFVMDCTARLDRGGPTQVRARLSIPLRPAEFTLRRADLIIGE